MVLSFRELMNGPKESSVGNAGAERSQGRVRSSDEMRNEHQDLFGGHSTQRNPGTECHTSLSPHGGERMDSYRGMGRNEISGYMLPIPFEEDHTAANATGATLPLEGQDSRPRTSILESPLNGILPHFGVSTEERKSDAEVLSAKAEVLSHEQKVNAGDEHGSDAIRCTDQMKDPSQHVEDHERNVRSFERLSERVKCT